MVRQSLISLFLLVAARGQSSSDVRNHIVRYEGYSHHAYYDRGHLAIGIGHRFQRSEGRAAYWTDGQIERAFGRDLIEARRGAYMGIANLSSQPDLIQTMMVAMCYSTGVSGFMQFKGLRRAIERRDYDEAARQLSKSLWSKQLTNRALDYQRLLRACSIPRYVLP